MVALAAAVLQSLPLALRANLQVNLDVWESTVYFIDKRISDKSRNITTRYYRYWQIEFVLEKKRNAAKCFTRSQKENITSR